MRQMGGGLWQAVGWRNRATGGGETARLILGLTAVPFQIRKTHKMPAGRALQAGWNP